MEASIEIGSDLKNFCEVEAFFKTLLKEFCISRKNFCKIYLAVNEAIINSMKHGNLYSIKKKVIIEFCDLEDKYIFKVSDEGEGFDFLNLPNPLHEDNIMRESGRGIFIMKQYTDELFFEAGGSIVNLIFKK